LNYEFGLAIELFGQRVERSARVNYKCTPQWEYFDMHKRGLRNGIGSSQMSIEVLTRPEEDNGNECEDPHKSSEGKPAADNDRTRRPSWREAMLLTSWAL
jgi:hypothetical protein